MKKVIYYVFICLITIILLLNTFSIFNTSLFGFRVFKIASGSMSPIYKVNDLVVVKKCSSYKKGEIVTFKNQNGNYVTHRIIKKDKNILTTKGDFNNTVDKPINEKKVIGKVVYRSRVVSLFNRAFSSTWFWILVPFVGIILLLIPRKESRG